MLPTRTSPAAARRLIDVSTIRDASGLSASLGQADLAIPRVIRLENSHGEEIVGLVNSSFPLDENPIPVVIIPPAFGKTKEVLFGLALTLIQNFGAAGEASGSPPLRRDQKEGREPQGSGSVRTPMGNSQFQHEPGRR